MQITHLRVLGLSGVLVACSVANQDAGRAPVKASGLITEGLPVIGGGVLAPQTGVLAIGGQTLPSGVVWVPPNVATGTPGTWFGGTTGAPVLPGPATPGSVCRLNATVGGPYTAAPCQLLAASPGQMVVAPVPGGGGNMYLFVTDQTTLTTSPATGNQVVRYTLTPTGPVGGWAFVTNAAGVAGNPVIVPNTTSTNKVGGATTAGRPDAIALATNGTDLYVGFSKSPDIVRVVGAFAAPALVPPATVPGTVTTLIARSNDARGILSFAMLGNDLYMSEGSGLTRVLDPAGNTAGTPGGHVACPVPPPGVATTCKGAPTNIESSPGGLASDGSFIYYGHAPVNRAAGTVSAWNPAALTVTNVNPFLLSTAVPTYFETAAGGGNPTLSHNTYVGPVGIGVSGAGALATMMIGDDPYYGFVGATPPALQGHYWLLPPTPIPPTVTSLAPASGPSAGGTAVVVTGTGFDVTPGGTFAVSFGATPAAVVVAPVCGGVPISCTATVTSPPALGGPVDVRVSSFGLTSPISPANDTFTYTAGVGPVVTAVNNVTNAGATIPGPATGVATGGTLIRISGANLVVGGALPTITIGGVISPTVACVGPASCTAVVPPSPVPVPPGAGTTVEVQINVGGAVSALTGVTAPPTGDNFTYVTPTGNLFAWGITAPKGGMIFLPQIPAGGLTPPGAFSNTGSWWSSDHGAGFCRLDPAPQAVTAATPIAAPGNTINAIDFNNCDQDDVGSPGQAVFDGSALANTNARGFASIHPTELASIGGSLADTFGYVYVPDNAVRSTTVWRLTYDATLQRLLPTAAEEMATLVDPAIIKTLKPNGMALGPDGNLYISDLTEPYIRQLTGPAGDVRLQSIGIVAITGDGRGANGTMSFIGNQLYVSENRAAAWFNITTCPAGPPAPPLGAFVPCATTPINLPAGVFIAGVATDGVRYVYAAHSPGVSA